MQVAREKHPKNPFSDLSQLALDIIQNQGVNDNSLEQIGVQLGQTSFYLSKMPEDMFEGTLNVEPDGTFELFLLNLKEYQSKPYCFAYDTWSVFSSCSGTLQIVLDGCQRLNIDTGKSIGVKPGVMVEIFPTPHAQRLCCLFGIARQHLPPPRDYK